MKKNDKIKLHITDIGVGGEGIGKSEGFPFFVKNAVIGDEVEAVITKLNKNYGFAKVLEVLEPSSWRTEPVCANAERCGGCQIMQLSYEKQLSFKENMVKNNLTRIGGAEFSEGGSEFLPIVGMSVEAGETPVHFRNKVQFPVGKNKEGKIVSGFYAGRTHYIIETESCPVSNELADKIMQSVCAFMEEHGISVYDEETGKGLVRHILIRNGYHTGQIMVCLVINGRKLKGASGTALEQKFVSMLTSLVPEITSISLNVNTKKTNVILGDEIIGLYGETYIEDIISSSIAGMKDLKFRISPLSFYQVNPQQTEKLYAKALEFAGLTGNEIVWDLYCGIGTISLFLAQKAKKVFGVEIVPDAIRDAEQNAVRNEIDNTEFFCGDSAEVFVQKVEDPANADSDYRNADVVVLDPPRKGCDASLLEAVRKVGPKKIVYVSCDPATLARDIKILTGKADVDDAAKLCTYELVKAQPVDMFPHTCHCETCCLLVKSSGTLYSVV